MLKLSFSLPHYISSIEAVSKLNVRKSVTSCKYFVVEKLMSAYFTTFPSSALSRIGIQMFFPYPVFSNCQVTKYNPLNKSTAMDLCHQTGKSSLQKLQHFLHDELIEHILTQSLFFASDFLTKEVFIAISFVTGITNYQIVGYTVQTL